MLKRIYHIAICITALLAAGNSYGQAPKFTYPDVNSFKVGTPITPLVPTQLGGAVPATIFGQITTFAGNGSPGATDANGLQASFKAPFGLKFDAAGNLYVADVGNNKIRKITPAGDVTTFAGTGAVGSADGSYLTATFNAPTGITIDKLGNVFIADRNNHTIRMITPAGTVSTLAGLPGASGLVNSQGTFARFNQPTGLAVDKTGGLFVADYGNNRIRHLGLDGSAAEIAGSTAGWVDGQGPAAKLNAPIAVYFDGNGLLYVGDDSHIRGIDDDNNVKTVAGSFFSGDWDGLFLSARFRLPSGIVADAAGTMFVADYGNSIIRRMGTDNLIVNIPGGPLNGPAGIEVDNQGNLYVADERNNVIRKITTTGYTISPALPPGLTFNSATGEISGTPLSKLQATNYSVLAYNTSGKGPYTFTLEVREAQLKPQTITFRPLADARVGDQDISPGAFSTNPTIPITYTTDIFSVAVIANGKIHLRGPGTAVVTAMQAGNTDYEEATPVSREIKVAPEPDVDKPTVEALPGPFIFALDQFGNYTVTEDQLAKITPGALKPTPTTTIRPTRDFTCEDLGELDLIVAAGYGPDPADPLNAEFDGPTALSYDASSGNLYISDQAYHVIRKYDTDTRVTSLAGGVAGYIDAIGPNAGFSQGLLSITNDSHGNAFVCDVNNNAVRRITPDGITTTFAGNALRAANGGKIFTPESIAIDASDNVFVADKVNIYKVSPDGSIATTFSGGFNGITGLTFDKSGNMFVSVNGYNEGNGVYKITPGGIVSIIYTVPSAAGFARLVVDSKGTIFVGSTGGVIYKITQGGQFSVYTGGTEGYGDGSLSKARFNNPQGIAIDPADNLYIADFNNHRIRKITPAGKVTTIAGSGKPGQTDNKNKSNAAKVTVHVKIVSELKFSTKQTDVTLPAAASCPAFLPNYADKTRALSVCANSTVVTQLPKPGTPVTIGQPVTVTLTATDNLGQTKDQTFTVSAVPLPKPVIIIAPTTAARCDGGPISFTAQTQGEGTHATYNWLVNGVSVYTGGKDFTSTILKTGDNVTCVVTNNDYCEPVDSEPSAAYAVSTDPSVLTSVTVSASLTDAICPGVAVTFTASPANDAQILGNVPSYQWKINGEPRGSNSAVFTANNLVDRDEVVCEMTSNIKCAINPVVSSTPIMVRVKTDAECTIKIPTAFTPNGDGVNDLWEIPELSSFPDCDFSIFNRYGKLVYHVIGYAKMWDGALNGKKLPAGTYYYMINLKTGRPPLSGPITILR